MVEHIKSLYDDSMSGDTQRRYEYFLGNPVAPNTSAAYKATVDSVIPVKAEPGSVLSIVDEGRKFEINFDGEKSMNARWFRINAGQELVFSSNKKFFMGNPISLIQEKPHKHKLILLILVDSLAQTVLETDGFEELMPYTSTFFSNAIYMQECYCCSDWTLPACATVFTGKYPYEHKMLHPDGGKLQQDTFVKLFKDAGYLTGYFNSNWRMPPEYGYIEGFDRGIYCRGDCRGKCVSLIECMMDHLYAFPNRDHFITLSLYDLHHHYFLDLPREVGTQARETLEEQAYRPPSSRKPTETPYVPMIAEIYKKQLKFMDYKLQMLYSFLSSNYTSDEYVVLFCADHGESTLSPPDFPLTRPIRSNPKAKHFLPRFLDFLRKQGVPFHIDTQEKSFILMNFQNSMQKTPLLIQSSSTKREDVFALTDLRSVYDIFSCILKNVEAFNNDEVKTICKREYVYNESIYPGQTYKAKIIDRQVVLYFESDELINENCCLTNSSGHMALFLRKNYEKLPDNPNIFEKYAPVIREHISQLGKNGSTE